MEQNFDENFVNPTDFIQPSNDAQLVVSNIYANCIAGLTSKYNDDYYCNITHFKVNDGNEIQIGIDMHGNNTMGNCQDPKTSSLFYIDENTGDKVKLEFKESKYTRQDKLLGYTGVLTYKCDKRKGKFCFKFGKSGYTEALFEVFPDYKILYENYPLNLQSKYNDDYYCNIEFIKVNSDSIHIGIDMHGNMSLGKCQDPKTSRLFFRNQDNEQIKMDLIDSELTRNCNKYGYTGVLKFAFKGEKGEYIFKFGKTGFTDAIFEIDY